MDTWGGARSASQAEPEQKAEGAQSNADPQDVTHWSSPQAFGAHEYTTGGRHVPAPSQWALSVTIPSLQDRVVHVVEASGMAQRVVVTPSQEPVHAEPSPWHAGRLPTGAPLVGVHVPTEPGFVQEAHCSPQSELQHTPSIQKADWH
jgi:hypothetical protein